MRGTWDAVVDALLALLCFALLSLHRRRERGLEWMEVDVQTWSERTQADLWPVFLGVFETTAR
jgi:hypothetical protein